MRSKDIDILRNELIEMSKNLTDEQRPEYERKKKEYNYQNHKFIDKIMKKYPAPDIDI